MADEKRINIGVNTTGADRMDKLAGSAKTMFSSMIRDARAYTTSAKEVNREIEKQIRLLESQSRKEYQSRMAGLEKDRTSGKIDERKYSAGAEKLGQYFSDRKTEMSLLRELIDAVKQTSKSEIIADRKNVEERIRQSTQVGELMPEGSAEQIYKETLQRAELGRVKGNEEKESHGWGRESINKSVSVIGASSMDEVLSEGLEGAGHALAATGPIVGAVLAGAALLTKVLAGAADRVESSAKQYSLVTGTGMKIGLEHDIKGQSVLELSKYGMRPSDYYKEYGSMAFGAKTSNFGESALNLMLLKRGKGLDEGSVNSLVGLRRFGGGSVSGTSNYLEAYLRKNGEGIEALTETVGIFTSTANSVIKKGGSVDSERLAMLMTGFGSKTGFKGELLSENLGKLESGLSTSDNPVIRYLQLKAAREAKGGNASLLDLEKITANPMDNPAYVGAFMKDIVGRYGTGDQAQRMVSNVFGVNPNQAPQWLQYASSLTGLNAKQTGMEMVGKFGSVDMSAAAAFETGALDVGQAQMQGGQEKLAMATIAPLIDKLTELIGKMGEGEKPRQNEDAVVLNSIADNMDNAASSLGLTAAELKQIKTSMKETADSLNRGGISKWNGPN